ncbi:putative signal transduction protein [Candidatus Accumulibacter aalborgensis]|uniref:Putative signal transduction protein n=1 Tax=Candidatus Accumulibacter aalborgensis TaxID=1860102 RepID=A0A1A8XN27_9PROT|nr:HDOD domain-containing protein [Candidatus Accumulibacter aalborgensis]SBT05827.1 putative signal transduction protein [Candidatus Accumulibacter aalborgensis]
MTEMTDETLNEQPAVDRVLEQALKDLEIPPRPLIIDRIKAEMNSDTPNLKRVGQLISVDVSLAAGLIKTVNSPYFGLRNRARSVHDALLLLGLDVTCRAVAAISLRQAFPNNGQLDRFWGASAQIAALSGWLAQQSQTPRLRADDAYTYGLFRDCGIAMLLLRFPVYRQTLERANADSELAFTTVEQQDFPTDHATIGCMLAQNRWLPEEICLAIRHHHDQSAIDLFDSGLPAASRHLVAISQTAEHIVQKLTGGSRTEEWTKLGSSCLRLLKLGEADLRELYCGAKEVLRTVD